MRLRGGGLTAITASDNLRSKVLERGPAWKGPKVEGSRTGSEVGVLVARIRESGGG